MINELIKKLIKLKEENSNVLQVISSIDGLILALKELENMIEIEGVKNAVSDQVKLMIILNLQNLQKDYKLHSVFYGPPGVGKSKMAKCVAKIWKELGVLKHITVTSTITASNIIDKINKSRRLALRLQQRSNIEDWSELHNTLENIGNSLVEPVKTNSLISRDDVEDSIIICGRNDFVAEYTGQTSIKTNDFLKKNVGKYVIIEEAYTLCLGDTDNYGMEALTAINLFMSEHPDDIVIMFTGYKDKLLDTIFKAQPGLMRRCQSVFEVSGYSSKGLSQIFIQQLNNKGWKLNNDIDIEKFFEENFNFFPYFGGDTERFVFRCQTKFSHRYFDEITSTKKYATLPSAISIHPKHRTHSLTLLSSIENIITYELLLLAFEEYKTLTI